MLDYIRIDKYSKMPLHEQLKASLVEAINNNTLQAGNKLPTEEEICKEFSISRPVVRQAYNDLLKEGRIIRIRAKGTFVKEKMDNGLFMHSVLSFTEEMRISGRTPSTSLISKKIVTSLSSLPFSIGLNLNPQEKYYEITRLRYADAHPFNVTVNILPMSRYKGIENEDLENNSLYSILEEKYNVKVIHANRSIQAIVANKELASLLNISPKSAILVNISYVYDQFDRLIEVSIEYMSGDTHRYDYKVSLY